jgi:HK97 family phage portal protein
MARKTKQQANSIHQLNNVSGSTLVYPNGYDPYNGYSQAQRKAMSISVVWRCVSLIAGTVATMPIDIVKVDNTGKRTKIGNDLWWLLNESPNQDYTATTLKEALVQDLLLNGDGFMHIERPSIVSNKISGLRHVRAELTTVIRPNKNGRLLYLVTDPYDGKLEGVNPDDMVQVIGAGFNGLRGMSVIKDALYSQINIVKATEEHTEAYFNNGTRPEYAIAYPEGISLRDSEVQDLRTVLADNHAGSKNNFKPLILNRGGKILPITLSQADAQLLESRSFQVDDIARFFGVPSVMVGSNSQTTWGKGIEELGRYFVQYTLMPILTKIEQELSRKLFPTNSNLRVKFDVTSLTRGDVLNNITAMRAALGRAGEEPVITMEEARHQIGFD